MHFQTIAISEKSFSAIKKVELQASEACLTVAYHIRFNLIKAEWQLGYHIVLVCLVQGELGTSLYAYGRYL